MKFMLFLLTTIALLPITGCVFPEPRDNADDGNRPEDEYDDEHLAGGDHGESR